MVVGELPRRQREQSTATTPLRHDHQENRTGQRALPTGNKPHTGEQLLTGGTKEDFVEALRAGAPATPEQQPSDLRHVELSRHPHHPRDRGEGV